MAYRGIGAYHGRQRPKARFIHKQDATPLRYGFFSTAGQRSSFQAWMAFSSLCLARRAGFCRLQPQARNMRPTLLGASVTPYSRRITSATRSHVQTSPPKPYASAPRKSRMGSWLRCSALNFGVGPGAMRRYSLCTPSSRACFIHWLTAPRVTPKALAMALCFQPCCFNSQARRRRPSRQSAILCVSSPIKDLYHSYHPFNRLWLGH